MNIMDEAGLTAAVEGIGERHGGIDVLVSTPAVNVRKRLLNYSGAEFDKVIDLNLKGTFLLTQAVGRVMEARRSGSIILFSSIRSVTVEPGQGVYAATKAGLVQLARALAAELGAAGVRVNCIAPGIVETPLTAQIKKSPEWYTHLRRGMRWDGGPRRRRWLVRSCFWRRMLRVMLPGRCCLWMAGGRQLTGDSHRRCKWNGASVRGGRSWLILRPGGRVADEASALQARVSRMAMGQ